jgi:hypothetical protein
MSDLDKAKGLIARGDKEKAFGLLASILIRNKDDMEAWLLLGDTIDDPAKKKDCYNQVLRLSPHNLHGLTRVQELGELPPNERQLPNSKEAQIDNKGSINKSKRRTNYVPIQYHYPVNDSKGGIAIISYVIGGIALFLLILYVIGSDSNSSNESNILWVSLIFLGLITGIIILSASDKNRN